MAVVTFVEEHLHIGVYNFSHTWSNSNTHTGSD